jgi:predicted aspartyl protease
MATRIKLNIFSLDKGAFHVKLKVKVNGKPASLILDTGASRTVIDMNAIKELLMEAELQDSGMPASSASSNDLQCHIGTIRELEIGSLKIKKYKCAVMDLTHVNMAYEMIKIPKVHGILGGDILKKYKAKINYETKTLTLGK